MDLISSFANILNVQQPILVQDKQYSSTLERNSQFIDNEIVPHFDIIIFHRKNMQELISKYLRSIKRIQQIDSTLNPSFRRLWSYLEFKQYSNILNNNYNSDLTKSNENNIETKTDQILHKEIPFVLLWAGSGSKGGNDVATPISSPVLTLISLMSFNHPCGLAVRTDTNGNPYYSGGIDGANSNVYVSDMLNHSIRVLIKPKHTYTLIGNSNSSSGSTIGPSFSATLHSPRGLCTVDMIDSTGLCKTILVIADSLNNSIKGIVVEISHPQLNTDKKKNNITLPDNEVFLLSGKSEKSTDLNMLNNPTGVCSYQDTIYICCRGDHTIRSLSFRKKVFFFSLFIFI